MAAFWWSASRLARSRRCRSISRCLKGCSIVGVFWGAFTRNEPEHNRRNNEELMQLFAAGKVKPHIHATYPLERAAEALNEVLNKRVSGKVVLTTD